MAQEAGIAVLERDDATFPATREYGTREMEYPGRLELESAKGAKVVDMHREGMWSGYSSVLDVHNGHVGRSLTRLRSYQTPDWFRFSSRSSELRENKTLQSMVLVRDGVRVRVLSRSWSTR